MTDEVLNLYKEVAAGGVGLIITWDGLHFLQFMHL
jgi:2,4-dienoyl-CoA reductase-like NADH-dependent reductase (Old Yellow Enzyme family)